jgi:hypothetical protein
MKQISLVSRAKRNFGFLPKIFNCLNGLRRGQDGSYPRRPRSLPANDNVPGSGAFQAAPSGLDRAHQSVIKFRHVQQL